MDAGDDPTIRTAIHDQRRRFLRALGVAGAVGVAGCLGGDDGEENGNGNGNENGGDDENGDGPTSAYFGVSGLDPDAVEVDQGDAFDVGATVENTGDIEGAQIVELQVDGEERATQSVTLDAGGETDVSFESVETENVEPGEHEFGVYTDDDAATGTLTVAEAGAYELADEAGHHVDVVGPDGAVGRYMYVFDPDDFYNTFKTYLHVIDPATDQRLTADPRDHDQFAHHRGIFIGWDRLTVDGEEYDLWHMDSGERMIHDSFEGFDEFASTQTLTSINHWITQEDETVIEETREMAFHEPETDDEIVHIDFTSTMEATGADVELLGDPEHAGIQYRPHSDVGGNESAEYVFPEGTFSDSNPSNDEINSEEGLRWAGQTHTIADQQYFVQHMNHPDNPDGTVYSAYRPYGRFGAFFEGTITAGESLTVNYGFVVKRGDAPSQDELAEYYTAYSERV